MQRSLSPVSRPSSAKTNQRPPKRNSTDIGPRSGPKSKTLLRSAEVYRKRRSRKGCTSVPEAQQLRMKQRYVAGMSVSKIAREEKRNWRTVNRVVKEPDVKAFVEGLRERWYGMMEEVLSAAVEQAIHGKDGWLAYQMLKDAGIVGHRPQENVAPHTEVDMETEEKAIERIAISIVKGAIEKHRFFGIPLPEADEAEAELKAKGEIGG